MKSKITLIVLLSVIFFLGALSFFLGYHYFKTQDEIDTLTGIVNELTKAPEVGEDVVVDETVNTDATATEPTVKEVEKLAIAKFDPNKIDGVVESVEEIQNTISIGNAKVLRQMAGGEIMGGYNGTIFELNGKNYTFGGTKIVDAIYASYGDGSASYYAVLLEDGTVQYAMSGYDLIFKKSTLENVVRIISLKTTTAEGRIVCTLGAITSDGVTHIINVPI